MAFSERETIIANPARRRRMTAKQKRYFGTKRQRAAVKSRPRKRVHNPGGIIAMTLGNPAQKGRKMAASHRTKKRTSHRKNAGHRKHKPGHAKAMTHHRRRRAVHNPHHRRRRHHNPAGFTWPDLFVLGGGALVGSTLSSAIPQWVLADSNTGMLGYFGNLVSTFVAAWLGAMLTRNRAFPAGILAGGIGSLMRRVIADYSLLGSFSAQLGMGDYMVSNWVTPQRLTSDFRSLTESNMQIPTGWGTSPPSMAISSSGVDATAMGLDDGSGGGRAAGQRRFLY